MPAPVFTSNDSEITRLEGLYVKERLPPAQISGAFLGVVGMVGASIRGPVNRAIEITSEARFREVFGGRDQGSGGPITNPMWQALVNKPFGKLQVVRAAAAAAVAATKNFANITPTDIIRVDASSVGAWGNNVTAAVENATDGDPNHFNLKVVYLGRTYLYKNLNVFTAADDNLLTTVGTDDGRPVTVTKLTNGRPINVAATALLTGSDGSIADSDFTGTGKAMEVLDAVKGLGVYFIAERSSSALKDKLEIFAATATDRLYLMTTDTSTDSIATASADVATRRSDRIVYCYNHPLTLDPETATSITVHPTSWMASILSQIDVDIHPGEEDTKKYTAGITDLTFPGLTREDYITLKEAGIAALENDEGFAFVSGVTTSLVPGKEQITRRRMADYIQISMARFLKHSVKKKNTFTRRRMDKAAMDAFLGDLQRAERVVKAFKNDVDVLNTPSQEALGVVKYLTRVQLIGHLLHLVLETEIGTGVTIEEEV